jgi:hypothetical protein
MKTFTKLAHLTHFLGTIVIAMVVYTNYTEIKLKSECYEEVKELRKQNLKYERMFENYERNRLERNEYINKYE